MKKVAIIAAHPDDEVFGCGGTILRHKNIGDEISFLWLTNGIGARSSTAKDIDYRNKEHHEAIKFIQPSYYQACNFPDNKLDSVPFLEIVQAIEEFLNKVCPDIVYTHFFNDLNIDHALTCKAVMTATRPGSNTFVREIFSFEVVSSTEWAVGSERFVPDTYINISEYIEAKKYYLDCYTSEMRDYPHPRSKENIIYKNGIRGAEMNLKYAESFVTLRRVIND